MENYIVINGKKAELTEKQLIALGIKIEKKDPFELEYEEYFYINPCGEVIQDYHSYGCITTEWRYHAANYCTDKDLMEQRALHETLNRLLWRYSMRHGGDEIDWSNANQNKYKIYYNDFSGSHCTEPNQQHKTEGAIYFISDKVANAAIREVIKPFMEKYPNFKW